MDNLKGNWYIVYTKTNSEFAARDSLICNAVVPIIQEAVTRRGKTRTELKPRYRNYVYVQHDGRKEFFAEVLANEYIVKIVSMQPVSAPEIEQILDGQVKNTVLKVNDSVKVVDKSFEGLNGVIDSQPERGVFSVRFNIMGTEITEQIPQEYLIKNG